MKIKIIFLGLMVSLMLHAESNMMVYGGSLDYSDSSKDDGWFAGAYFKQSWSANSLELAYDRTEISYVDANVSNLKQNDFTVIWTHYLGDNYLTRFGGHYIDSNDDPSDEGFSVYAGLKYFDGYFFDAGVDLYYSNYTNYVSEDLMTKGLDVIQIEPSVGFSFGDYSGSIGSFYTKIYYDYIRPDNDGFSRLRNDYHSAGLLLTNFNGKWTTVLGGWIGKQVFAVRKEGFVVYNLSEEYKGGAEISVHYAFSGQLGIKVQYGYGKFKEINYDDASSDALSGFLNYRF